MIRTRTITCDVCGKLVPNAAPARKRCPDCAKRVNDCYLIIREKARIRSINPNLDQGQIDRCLTCTKPESACETCTDYLTAVDGGEQPIDLAVRMARDSLEKERSE